MHHAVATKRPTDDFFMKPTVFGPYYLIREIGQGAFGITFLAVLRHEFYLPAAATVSGRELFIRANKHFVVKRCRITGALNPAATKEIFEAERKRASWIRGAIERHDNLVQFVTSVDDRDTGTEAIVFEYCNRGGNLDGSL